MSKATALATIPLTVLLGFTFTLLAILVLVAGCWSNPSDHSVNGWLETPSGSDFPMTYEEFRARSQVVKDGLPDGFVVESHIPIHDESSLRAHYELRYTQSVQKSTGYLTGGGSALNPTRSTRRSR